LWGLDGGWDSSPLEAPLSALRASDQCPRRETCPPRPPAASPRLGRPRALPPHSFSARARLLAPPSASLVPLSGRARAASDLRDARSSQTCPAQPPPRPATPRSPCGGYPGIAPRTRARLLARPGAAACQALVHARAMRLNRIGQTPRSNTCLRPGQFPRPLQTRPARPVAASPRPASRAGATHIAHPVRSPALVRSDASCDSLAIRQATAAAALLCGSRPRPPCAAPESLHSVTHGAAALALNSSVRFAFRR